MKKQLYTKEDRMKSILNNNKGEIYILNQPNSEKYARSNVENYSNSGNFSGGKIAVEYIKSYGYKLEKEAEKQGVDPKLALAIMYMEASHGSFYGAASEWVRWADSILPMNVRSMWLPLGKQGADLRNIDDNIQIGVTLIKRIQDRLENPTVEKIATLYNSLAKDEVTDYGARVGEIYKTQPWKKYLKSENEIQENTIKTAENLQNQTAQWNLIPLNIEQSDERYTQIKQHIENILTDKFSVVNCINEEVQEKAIHRTV